jgi:hypothetical protein
MMVDGCLIGVARCACWEPRVLVLWECGAVADGCFVLLGAMPVAAMCALHLAAADLHRRCPALVVACPYMCGGC